MITANQLKKELDKLSNSRQAEILQRFFKTGKGQYGEGDIFLGIKVPVQRIVVKNYQELCLAEIEKLLKSKIHEYRLCALFILVDKYKKADGQEKKKYFDFYLKNSKNINNWDLVDLSAPHIVGNYLLDKPRDILYKLAKSKNLWQKRIAVLATYTFIRNNEFDDTLKLSRLFVNDEHDLIHKAVGWMLREVGKRDQKIEEQFLKNNYKQMPRVMLRYAIEKFNQTKKKFYLKK